MKHQTLRSRLRGVIGFPITPFTSRGGIHRAGLRKNLRAMLQHPMCAIVAAGGTGELYSLTPDEHVQVVRTCVEEAKGRIPVIAGVGFNARIAADLAREAVRAGASAILAFPPYYPNADDDGLFNYYRAIGAATTRGLIIYSRDWFHPTPAFVERLCRIPTLCAWKEGQADIRRYQQIIHRVGARLHWIGGAGDDLVASYYGLGIRVYTSSIANVSPKLSLLLHEAASAGDSEMLKPLMDKYVTPLYAFRARRKGYEVSVMKSMMDLAGQVGGPVRPPLPDVRPEEVAELKRMMAAWAPVL